MTAQNMALTDSPVRVRVRVMVRVRVSVRVSVRISVRVRLNHLAGLTGRAQASERRANARV